MTFENRLRQLESHAPVPACPECQYPQRSCGAVVLHSREALEQAEECTTCGRTLNPNGVPTDDTCSWVILHLEGDEQLAVRNAS